MKRPHFTDWQQELLDSINKKPVPQEILNDYECGFRVGNVVQDYILTAYNQTPSVEEWQIWAECQDDTGMALRRGYAGGLETSAFRAWMDTRRLEALPDYLREVLSPGDYFWYLKQSGVI